MDLLKKYSIAAILGSIILFSIVSYSCSKADSIPNMSYELIVEIKDHTGKDALISVDEDEIQKSIKILGENNIPLKGSYKILDGDNSNLLKITCNTDREIKLREINYIIDGEELLGTSESYKIKAYWAFERNNMHTTEFYFNDKQVDPTKEFNSFTYYSIEISGNVK